MTHQATRFLFWITHVVFVIHAQHTLLYYDDMEDIQATGWFQEASYFVDTDADNQYFCQGSGGVSITSQSASLSSGEVRRNFDIYGYTDLVVAVDIGEVGLSGSYQANLIYYCDPEWGQAFKYAVTLGDGSGYRCDYNFTITDYSDVICSNAKTLNLAFYMWYGTAAKAYIDEVRIYYGSTYAKTPSTPYDIGNLVYMYDDMQAFRNTGWILPDQQETSAIDQGRGYCGSDGGDCLELSSTGAYVTQYNMDTTANSFVAVQYIFGTDFSVTDGGSSKFAQVQYTCGDGETFEAIATHIGGTSSTQYTAILPCTSSNTAIRLYVYGSSGTNFDEICLVSWNEGTNEWSSSHCPNSVTWTDYSSSIYWYDNFENDLTHWTIDVPDVMTQAFWLNTDTFGLIMDGTYVSMAGNSVSLISRAMNGYSISNADIQFDIQSSCGRDVGDEFIIEIVCGLANYEWNILQTFYGDFEAGQYIVSSICDQSGINQMRFRSVASSASDYVYIDNVYYCRSGECPGDEMVNPNTGIIFYESNVTISDTSWVHASDDSYYRRRFNNLNTCDDLFVQYDILKGTFMGGDSVTVEYKYDTTATDSYCIDVGWSTLTIHSGADFVDQEIIQIPTCPFPFDGFLTIRFKNDAGKFASIENFYLCNGRISCPAKFPTTSPTVDPTTIPSYNPTKAPSNNPSATPSRKPTPEPTLPRDDSIIAKEGYNCYSGYQDLPDDDPYYNVLCERCPDGSAGTYGKCEECGFLEVPNGQRDACEYYQPWWLWLAETAMGLGCVGVIVIVYKKRKNRRRNKQETHNKMEMVTSEADEPSRSPVGRAVEMVTSEFETQDGNKTYV